MRAHDVAIGLAVAWARRMAVLKARRMLPRASERAVTFAADATIVAERPLSWPSKVHLLLRGENVVVDRGLPIEPELYTNARVAFGIACATKRGYWRRATLEDCGAYARLWWPPIDERESRWMRDTVDLDPRRWRRTR